MSANSEIALLRKLWIKAYESPEPIEIDCKTEQRRYRMRFSLYNSVKNARKNPERDPDLAAALAEVRLSCPSDRPGILILMKSDMTDIMQIVAEVVGETGAQAQEDEAAKSLAKVLKKLGEDPADGEAPKRVTPYYTRDR